MKRIMFGALLVSIALMVFAGDLWAHGGQYRGPGGAVPPNQREPSDPTPPAPPPPPRPPHNAAPHHAFRSGSQQPDHAVADAGSGHACPDLRPDDG
jgi:hypothetical protein